jgi:hypothetical protein
MRLLLNRNQIMGQVVHDSKQTHLINSRLHWLNPNLPLPFRCCEGWQGHGSKDLPIFQKMVDASKAPASWWSSGTQRVYADLESTTKPGMAWRRENGRRIWVIKMNVLLHHSQRGQTSLIFEPSWADFSMYGIAGCWVLFG